jgi:hypothetical protein
MRALTVIEIATVSGGEAPCITLRTPCVHSPPTAEDLRNGFAGLAALAGMASLAPAPQVAAPANAVSKVSAVLAWIAHQFVDEGQADDDQDKAKENDKKKGT